MAILAAETGLGRSSLYHHFPDGKEAMAAAALDRVEEFLTGPLRGILTADAPVNDRADRVSDLLLTYYENGSLGCLLNSLAMADAPPPIVARVRALSQRWIATFAEFAAASGVASPQDAAVRAIVLIHGGLILAAGTGESQHFECALGDAARVLWLI